MIPIIDELLDELRRAWFFTKFNLWLGHHQICMHPEDKEKLAFHIHQSHYKFMVIIFGLTNTHVTFQNMMKEVFKSFLCKFISVFFFIIFLILASQGNDIYYLCIVCYTFYKLTNFLSSENNANLNKKNLATWGILFLIMEWPYILKKYHSSTIIASLLNHWPICSRRIP